MSAAPRTTRSSRARRREELRDQLLTVAEAAIESGGNLTRLQLGELCATAGIPRSTFYVHFADRGELLSAWLDAISGRLESVGAEWWRLDSTAERPDVRAALASLVHTYRPHAALMRELYAASAADPALRDQVDTVTARNIRALRKHIVTGQGQGWIAADLPAAETAGWLMCMAARGQHTLVAAATESRLEDLIDGLTDVVWFSLYAFAPARL